MGKSAARGCLLAFGALVVLLVGLVAGYAVGAGRNAVDSESAMPAWSLPFAAGESWAVGGPHTDAIERPEGVRNALDFAPVGTEGRVLTIAAGTVGKVECADGFYLVVDLGDGWVSSYYHLVNQQQGLVDVQVPAGTYLGDVGTETPCGGRADGPHVHLALFHKDRPVPVDGVDFGGFRVFGSDANYAGFWLDGDGYRVAGTSHDLACCVRADIGSATPAGSLEVTGSDGPT